MSKRDWATDWSRKLVGLPQPEDDGYNEKIDKILPFIVFGILILLGIYAVYLNAVNSNLMRELQARDVVIQTLKEVCKTR